MKKLFFVFALLCLLAACGQPTQTPATPNERGKEIPLLTDADFDKAVKQAATHVTELFGSQESAAALQELPPLADVPLAEAQGELSAQAVLSNWDSIFVYAAHDPLVPPSNGVLASAPYRIYLRDTIYGVTRTWLLYEGYREVQSVQMGQFTAVISMRETTDPSSDFEVFEVGLCLAVCHDIMQRTFDAVDNTNVSVSPYFAADYTNAHQQPINGKATIVVSDNASQFVLSHPDPQRHPSVNAGGDYIALVRDPINGNDSIQRWDRANQSYLTVAKSPSPTIRMDSPSISPGGQHVVWVETDSNGFQEIKLADLNAGTVRTVASGTLLAHPHLYGLMTYQEDRSIFVKNLETGEVEVVVAANPVTNSIRYYSPSGHFHAQSQVAGSLQVNISGLPSGQNRVRVTRPNGFDSGLFSSSRLLENLLPGWYTISAQGFRVNAGRPTCRIYTPDFFSETSLVLSSYTRNVNVIYRSEPCGF